MSPVTSILLTIVLGCTGSMFVILAFGMWLAARKYPAAEPPTDSTERAIYLSLFGFGICAISMEYLL